MSKFVTLTPTFTIVNAEEVEKVMKTLFDKTSAEEPGCLYYSWVQKGDTLKCREAYKSGAALNTHIQNALPILGPALDAGYLKMESAEVTGPKEELEIAKETCDGLGAEYFALSDHGCYVSV